MNQYKKWSQEIFDNMDSMIQHCRDVQEADRCEDCKLKKCLCYDSMSEVFEECTASELADFILFADGVLITDEDIWANIANEARQDDAVYGE